MYYMRFRLAYLLSTLPIILKVKCQGQSLFDGEYLAETDTCQALLLPTKRKCYMRSCIADLHLILANSKDQIQTATAAQFQSCENTIDVNICMQ